MSDSDDDPWPGAYCGRTRYVTRNYYTDRYTLTEPFLSFFGIDPRPRYTMYDIESIVLDYINTHKGYTGRTIHTIHANKMGDVVAYDEDLWKLFGLSPDKSFYIRSLLSYIEPFRQGYTRPCPICEQLRPFHSRIPNGLCDACASSPDLLDSNGVATMVKKPVLALLPPGSFLTRKAELEENHFTLHGIPCRRPRYSMFSFALEAVVHCPLCQTEVNEERRFGAFCDRCASSECLVDENGNRVRFTRPMEDVGFTVVCYENGEITETPHIGEFVCFFQGVECIADDIGVNDRVIVRCRDRESEKRTWLPIALPPPLPGYSHVDCDDSVSDVGPATDWLDPRYPRWAAF